MLDEDFLVSLNYQEAQFVAVDGILEQINIS